MTFFSIQAINLKLKKKIVRVKISFMKNIKYIIRILKRVSEIFFALLPSSWNNDAPLPSLK